MVVLILFRRKTEIFGEAEFAALLDSEAEAVRVMYAEGVVRHGWTRQDVPGAVLQLEVPSLEGLEEIMQRLPLYSRGMLDATVVPLTGYRGFGPRG